jgi:hypothetical protein
VTATGLVSSAHRSCLSWHKTIRRLCRGRRGRRNDFSVVARLHGRPRESASFRLLLRYDEDEDDDLCGCLQDSCGEMYSMHGETGRPIGRQERLLRHTRNCGASGCECVLPLVAGKYYPGMEIAPPTPAGQHQDLYSATTARRIGCYIPPGSQPASCFDWDFTHVSSPDNLHPSLLRNRSERPVLCSLVKDRTEEDDYP